MVHITLSYQYLSHHLADSVCITQRRACGWCRNQTPKCWIRSVMQELSRANTRLADLERKFGFGEFGHQPDKASK